jgi:ABC-type amino acid transport substrate-binding protein
MTPLNDNHRPRPEVSKKLLAGHMDLCVYMLLSASVGIFQQNQYAHATQASCDVLRVGGSDNMYPIAYIDKITNHPEGLGYELVNQLGEHIGIPVTIEANYPWPRMMNLARQGELDVVAGLLSTPEREKFMYFTEPFYTTTLYAFVHRKSRINLTSIDDLTEYTRVNIRGNSVGKKLDAILKPTTVDVNNERQQISMVVSGRADYFLDTRLEFTNYQRNYLGWEKIKRLPLPIETMDAKLGISKASPCVKYLEQFNRIISKQHPTK